jgi:gliding motility-associated-like protein
MEAKMLMLRKVVVALLLIFGLGYQSDAQSGTEFWLAPPDVSDDHGSTPLYVVVSSNGAPATVTISMPANNSFATITQTVAANQSARIELTSFRDMLETRPTNQVLNTGLRIHATSSVTCYYECAHASNTDIWALKGPNSLGKEFYIPLHKYAPFYNHSFATHKAIASFDICATEDNTIVTIYSPTAVDGHAALTQFSVTLNTGQTYSCGWTGANYTDPATHPSGAVVLANKNITVTIKDDSNHNPSGGCYDIMGDQIVPVDILGTDYVAVKGSLNATGDESMFVLATQNNTQVFVNGATTPIATLFAGESYRIDMDHLSTGSVNSVYVRTSKPVYATHVTGFGCEMGMAVLPPLNCAGSQALNFTRTTNENFYITLLCRSHAINGFTMTGPTAAMIPVNSFITVPGTGGEWMAARITYTTAQIQTLSTYRITNSIDVFALGIGNGGASSGCRYGYFSEFVAPISVNAGADQTICSNTAATLEGSVAGGTTTGLWTSSGSGSFTPSASALNAVYTPSAGDISVGYVTLTLTSTGACNPVSDQMVITLTPAPVVNAGADIERCSNNSAVSLQGTVTNALGGVWTGGLGTYELGNNTLTTAYYPTAAEIAAGSLVLTLTSNGSGICAPTSDNVIITFTPAPTANAGADQVKCGNNATVSLSGSVTVATGGTWTGGSGVFSSNTSLNPIYTPTEAEIASGSVTLTLTTTNNGLCNAVSDNVTITFTTAPQANAGPDQTKCANNAEVQLVGSYSIANGAQWSGGLGTFLPNSATTNAKYNPTAAEINNGSVTLTLTTTGNGTCVAASDAITIYFSPAPTVNAGNDVSVCANNSQVTLNGSYTIATGGVWSGGAGSYSPSNTAMNAVYTPTPAERAAGTVTLTLTTTSNGTCVSVTDQVVISITPAPTVNAGLDRSMCANNASVTLNGNITGATGGIWSGGAGNFSPSTNALNAVYTPTATEIANGSVTLTLTSTGNGNCTAVSDNMTISFTTAPTANAGPDQTKCANNATTQLAGSVTIATGGQWSGGLGVFSPSASALNATYTPTASEINSGSVTLTLTTTGNNTCNAVTDQMVINFTPAPTVNAGTDITTCANNAMATLNGSFTIAGGAIWSGGNGTFSPNNTTMSATYVPTPAEIATGSVTLTLTSTGNNSCTPVTDQVVINITPAPTVNAGADFSACSNNPVVTLNGNVVGATGGVWSGGAGSFSPSANATNAIYTPTASEIAAGSVTLTLTSTGNGNCNAVSDNVTIQFTASPTVNAGADQIKCANNAAIQLTGAVTIATGGQWTGGLGIFNPSANALNATYTPTTAEINSGSVTLTLTTTGNNNCTPVTDQITIQFTPAPTVNAGNDITVCANNPVATLNGSFTVANGIVWSGGNGVFSPNNTTANATYTPTPAEIASGLVSLTLTTTGNGTCIAVTDVVTITITAAPVVNAGADIAACANNTTTSLNGQVFGATGGIWSGGNGTFFPNNTVLNATYTPTTAEVESGMVMLTLTSSGNGTCIAVTDQVIITYAPAPVVNAGNDQTLCSNNATIQLNGFVNNSAGGQWSGGLGVFAPSANALSATYTPSSTEIAQGYVVLTLTSTGNGTCLAVTDEITISFTPAPTVDAGDDMTSCANSPQVELTGSFTVATGILWSGGLGSYSPNGTSANMTYTPTNAEIEAGEVTLTLTTTGNGSCLPESDEVTITIVPAPVVNAGTDQVVCVNNLNVALSGSIVGVTNTGIWTTTGTGSFLPTNTALNATYVLSSADSLAGGVTLTLTSTANGTCLPVADQMVISVLPAGTANAGSDITVCANNAYVSLNGTVAGGATSGVWSTTGTGAFSPSANMLNATYVPSAFDIANGNVTLTLTANSCNTAADNLTVTFTPAPEVNAGTDQTVCSSETEIELNGSIAGSASSAIWTTNGSGTFTPSANALNASYTPSTADVNAQNIHFILTSSNNGNCSAVSDTVYINIYPTGTVNAGNDQSICANNANVELNGSISGGATEAVWSTSGSGFFIPNAQTLNATYVPNAGDILIGNVNLVLTATNSCNTAIDFMNVTFTPAPIVDAGSDHYSCGANPSIALNGTITNAGGAIWSGGNGTFTPSNTDLNAIYMPSVAEQAAGSVTLTLTSTNNGLCNAVADQVTLHFSTGVVVNAGNDQVVCNTSTQTVLQGNVSNGATAGIWTTSGSGTFVPDATALNAIYEFSAADLASGGLTLTLTSTDNGICPVSSDQMQITFGDAAYANAGNDQNICASFTEINLNGMVSGGATQGIWTATGFGSFSPSSSSLQTTYAISPADITLGQVSFILNTTDHGVCLMGTDTVTFTISQSSTVNAGADVAVCGSNLDVALSGVVSGASNSGMWSTLGSGVFTPNNTDLNAHYIPSANDSLNGTVTLVLTSTNTGLCPVTTDTLVVTIERPATVIAGNDISVCAEVSSIALNGSISGGDGTAVWSTTGSGSFTPDNHTMNASYVPSSSDINVGSIALILSSSASGICPVVADTLHLSFTSLSIVNAGADFAVCGVATPITLNGQVSGPSTTGVWNTLGSGTFADNSVLNTTYQPSLNDSLVGSVQLVLQSTNTGLCATANDTISIIINAPAMANAGADQTVCATQSAINLNGIISGGTSTGVWSTTGSGSFNPGNTSLNATYTPSAADVVNGSISITLTSTGNGVCAPALDEVIITFEPTQTVNAGNDRTLCENVSSIELGGIISGNNATGMWTTTGSGTFSPSASDLNATYTFSGSDIATGEIVFTLTPTSTSMCPGEAATFSVNLVPAPIAAFSTVVGDSLNVSFVDESIGAGTWLWNFGVGGTSTAQNASYTYPEAGSYDVSLIVTAAGGCADTAYATVRLIQEEEYKPIAIPTGFSPNNDGNNDELRVLGGPFSEVDFRIYNGWGNLVFSTTDPNQGWDGTYKGEAQPGGVYVYTAVGITTKGRYIKTSGSVTLIR